MNSLIDAIKDNKVLFALVVLFVACQLFVVPRIISSDLNNFAVTALNIPLLIPIAYLLVFGKRYNHYRAFVVTSLYGLPALSLMIVALFFLKPRLADSLAREDYIIESLTALAAIAGGLILGGIGIYFAHKNAPERAVFAFIAAAAFVVIGMEEISWGQRIFAIESSRFFLENNMQKEINLHNLDTNLAMTIFYALIFLVFVVVPFWRKQVEIVLERLRLKELSVFISSSWLIVPYAVSLGYATQFFMRGVEHQVALTLTLAILCWALIEKKGAITKYTSAMYLAVASVIIALPTFMFLLDYSKPFLRHHVSTEYKELFMCVVILLYAIDLSCRIFAATKNSQKAKNNSMKIR